MSVKVQSTSAIHWEPGKLLGREDSASTRGEDAIIVNYLICRWSKWKSYILYFYARIAESGLARYL